MSPARFGCQVLLVLALVALVSWPEQRALRAGAFWQGRRPVLDRTRTSDEREASAPGRQSQIGHGSASEAALGTRGAAALQETLRQQDAEGSRRRLPPVLSILGGKLNAIVGSARTATNGPLPFANIVLRNLTTGVVEARATADDTGRFSFVDVIPGGYLVELLDNAGNVIAVSGPVAVGVNDVRETVVRPPARRALAPFGGALIPTAQEAVGAAAGDGVNRIAAPERCASPPCLAATP